MTSESDIGTKILFGDGMAVSTLESDSSEIDTRIFNSGDNNNIISCSFKDNLMSMNGFEVFRFTRNVVPQLINSYLEGVGKSLASYDLLALHQASKLVVATICSTLKYKNTLCDDFSCEEIGNLGSGSIGAWLSNINQLASKGKLNMLAVGFGSGLSWGLASVVVDVQTNEVIYV
jgi:3-oxoacyl-[acyl-carrier-protein] synthase-3